jgi:cyclopropane fatty-acyl-phospholipid synthase-like methyltransferase
MPRARPTAAGAAGSATVVAVAAAALVLVSMSLCQLRLDRSRSLSLHCVVRNTVLSVGAVLYLKRKVGLWTLVALVLATEVVIEVAHQFGLPLDPYIHKVLNYYRWADTLWSSRHIKAGMDNFTEGRSDCDPHLPIPASQPPKFEWMARQCKLRPGARVLEVGCGNGEFMRYVAENFGATAVGVTPSPDQARLLAAQGLDVRMIDVWSIGSAPELHGAFDAVVLNGSTEHFLNVANGKTPASQAVLFDRMFALVRMCLDPASDSRRCVITAIHMHRDLSAYEMLQMYLLERSYGGYYAHTPSTYVECAQRSGFAAVTLENRTLDYYIWARKIWYNVYAGLVRDPGALLAALADVPVFALNDPYYLHKLLHLLFGTWSWQFSVPSNPLLARADTPPTVHLWMTLELPAIADGAH